MKQEDRDLIEEMERQAWYHCAANPLKVRVLKRFRQLADVPDVSPEPTGDDKDDEARHKTFEDYVRALIRDEVELARIRGGAQ